MESAGARGKSVLLPNGQNVSGEKLCLCLARCDFFLPAINLQILNLV